MMTEHDIIRIEQQEIQRAIKDGWTLEPWKGRKPEVEGFGRPILAIRDNDAIFIYGGKFLAPKSAIVVTSGYDSAYEAYNRLKPDRIHFTGAWVYDN
jgi:hypothetical protein